MDNKSTSKEWYKKPIFIIPAAIIVVWLILPQSTKYGLISLFGGLLSLAFWGGIIFGAIWLYRKYNNSSNRIKIKIGYTTYRIKKSREKELAAQKEVERLMLPQKELWNQLGSSKDEREKNIKKMFDSNNKNLSVGISWDFIEGLRAYGGPFLQFRINRNLAAMEQREREFLRIAYSLYNNGQINDNQFEYYNFSLINGDGKAAIEEYRYSWGLDDLTKNSYLSTGNQNGKYEHRLPNNCESLKDGPTTVKFYQDHARASVDSAINNLLKIIEEVGQNNENIKQVKDIKKRIHGDGSWLDEDEVEGTVYSGSSDYQLSLGHLDENGATLHYSGEGSLITIAPPGSGKTQCFVIPNMLNWKGAAVVLDIKGEIYTATHKWREKNVGKVYKFSPLDPNNSSSYNPLTFVRDEPDYIWEDSRFLADMMIVPSGASDPFWENMARDVLTAAIAHVTFNNEPDDRAMSKVLDIIYGIGWDEMITSLKTNVLVSSMRRMGSALEEMEKKQRDSVLKTAQSSLSAWQGERIAKVTNKSDWNPLDLRNGTPTIYICINPNEIESYLSVIRVFIAQHIRMLTTELPQRGAAPVLFMLDELPRLKKMPPVDEALNIGRQYGIKLWMFAQSYGQLKDAYSDPEGLIGSCVVRTFMNLPLNDEYTTKISDQLGYRHDALGNTKEKLVEPIELAGPNYRDYILVMATGTKPAKVKKKFAYEDEEIKAKMN